MDDFIYVNYDPEGYNDDLEELDIDQYEAANAAEVIARKGRINIMRNMTLTGLLVNQSNKDIAGVLWVNEPTADHYFSFDMAIHPNYRGKGLANNLVKVMIDEYKYHNSIYTEMHGKRLPLNVTVVNPILINVLKKYGFRIDKMIDSEKVYMTHDTLKESPDGVRSKEPKIKTIYKDSDAIPFGYIDDVMQIGRIGKGETHNNMLGRKTERDDFDYAGRLWVNKRVISFWQYPRDTLTFNRVIQDLNKYSEINIDNSWFIEIPTAESWYHDDAETHLIPLKDFYLYGMASIKNFKRKPHEESDYEWKKGGGEKTPAYNTIYKHSKLPKDMTPAEYSYRKQVGVAENLIKIVNEEIVNLLNEATATEIWEKFYNTIPHEEFLDIIAADPTSDVENNKIGKYSKWLLNLYRRKSMQLEDLYKAEEYLETFEKYINRIENKDINKYKSLPDLYNAVKDFINSDEPTSRNDAIRRIKKDAEKVYEDNQWLVVVPKTEEAACYYGKNTQWCTAAEQSRNMFDSYNKKGKLYININKITNEKFQFHFENEEFKNETDEDILPDDVGIEKGTGIFDFYEEKGYNLPEPTIEYAIKNGDYDLLQHLLWHDDSIEATQDDFDYAIDDGNYSMADMIFWNIDINNLSRWGVETYLDKYDALIEGRFYPENEGNKKYINNIKKVVEHIMQIENVYEDIVLKFVFERLKETKNIKLVLNKNFKDLVDRLIASDMSPDDIEDITYTYNISEETIYELIHDYKTSEEFKKIAKKPIENDRIRVEAKQVNFNEDDNKFYYFVNILFKKDNKQYEGWLEKSKTYRLLTQYDLFHGE